MRKIIAFFPYLLWLSMHTAAVIGCNAEPESAVPVSTTAPTPSPSATEASPENAGALGPLSRYVLPIVDRLTFEGVVAERIDAGSYGYLRVIREDTHEHVWVATVRPSIVAGAHVRAVIFGQAHDFSSRRLQRHFEKLFFAAVRPV